MGRIMNCELCETDMTELAYWTNDEITICEECFDLTRDAGGIKKEDIDETSL